MKKYKIGMLLFPDVTILDFIGPYDVFVRTGCFEVYLVSEDTLPLTAEGGLVLQANYNFETCPALDILFVPGGRGITPLLTSHVYISFLRSQAVHAQYITSVCTGSLVLAAAGLLKGFKATTHWRSLELLALLGVEAIDQRIVVDRSRITGSGITAGIDFGLTLTSIIGGEDVAKTVQLMLEYQPEPPFNAGSPHTADAHILNKAKQLTQPLLDERKRIIQNMIK